MGTDPSWWQIFCLVAVLAFFGWVESPRQSPPRAAAPAPAPVPEETQDVARPPPTNSQKKTPTTRFAEIHARTVVRSAKTERLRQEEWAKKAALRQKEAEESARQGQEYMGKLGKVAEKRSSAALEHKAKRAEPLPLPSKPIPTPPPTPPQTPPMYAGDDVGKSTQVPQDPLPAPQPTPPPTPDAGDDVAVVKTTQQISNHFEGLGTPKRITPAYKPTKRQRRDGGTHRSSLSGRISPELGVPSLSAVQKGNFLYFTWQKKRTYFGITKYPPEDGAVTKLCTRLSTFYLEGGFVTVRGDHDFPYALTLNKPMCINDASTKDVVKEDKMEEDERSPVADARLNEDDETMEEDEEATESDTLIDESMDTDEEMMEPTSPQDAAPQIPAAPTRAALTTSFSTNSMVGGFPVPLSSTNSRAGFGTLTSSLSPSTLVSGPPAVPQGFLAPKNGGAAFTMLPPSYTPSTSSSAPTTSLPGLSVFSQPTNSNSGTIPQTAAPSAPAAPNNGLISSTFAPAQQPPANTSSAATFQVGSSTSSPFAVQSTPSSAQTAVPNAHTVLSTSGRVPPAQPPKPSTRGVQPPAQQDPGAPKRNTGTSFLPGLTFIATSAGQTYGNSTQQKSEMQIDQPTKLGEGATPTMPSNLHQSPAADATHKQHVSGSAGPYLVSKSDRDEDKGRKLFRTTPPRGENALFADHLPQGIIDAAKGQSSVASPSSQQGDQVAAANNQSGGPATGQSDLAAAAGNVLPQRAPADRSTKGKAPLVTPNTGTDRLQNGSTNKTDTGLTPSSVASTSPASFSAAPQSPHQKTAASSSYVPQNIQGTKSRSQYSPKNPSPLSQSQTPSNNTSASPTAPPNFFHHIPVLAAAPGSRYPASGPSNLTNFTGPSVSYTPSSPSMGGVGNSSTPGSSPSSSQAAALPQGQPALNHSQDGAISSAPNSSTSSSTADSQSATPKTINAGTTGSPSSLSNSTGSGSLSAPNGAATSTPLPNPNIPSTISSIFNAQPTPSNSFRPARTSFLANIFSDMNKQSNTRNTGPPRQSPPPDQTHQLRDGLGRSLNREQATGIVDEWFVAARSTASRISVVTKVNRYEGGVELDDAAFAAAKRLKWEAVLRADPVTMTGVRRIERGADNVLSFLQHMMSDEGPCAVERMVCKVGTITEKPDQDEVVKWMHEAQKQQGAIGPDDGAFRRAKDELQKLFTFVNANKGRGAGQFNFLNGKGGITP